MTGKTGHGKGRRNKRGRNGRMTGRGEEDGKRRRKRRESIAGREDGQGEVKRRRAGGRKSEEERETWQGEGQ